MKYIESTVNKAVIGFRGENQSPVRSLARRNWMTDVRGPLLFLGILFGLMLLPFHERAHAQSVNSAPAAASSSPNTESNSPELSPQQVLTFKKQVNLVMVPVVVRDKKGKTVGSLRRDDFQILDEGKPQAITTFSVETNPVDKRAHENPLLGKAAMDQIIGTGPQHYFAYLFDDMHLQAGDLMQVRAAAQKHLASGLEPRDRAAVFTTSGDVMTDFTGDAAEVSQAMNKVKPRLITSATQCPYMSYFLAQRIMEEDGMGQEYGSGSTPILDAVTLDAWNCLFQKSLHLLPEARRAAVNAARQEKAIGDDNTRRSLLAIQLMVRRLAAMPGSRVLILISPGFQTNSDHSEQDIVIDLATKQNIVVNALDARGLYTETAGADDRSGPSDSEAAQMEGPYLRASLVAQNAVLAELSDGTGGRFFRDSNDLVAGFDQLAAMPEYVYQIGFNPADLKHPGRFHHLKIVLPQKHGFSVQARRGYTETSGADANGKQLSAELEQALFSRDQVRNFPIALRTGYAPKDAAHRELSVIAHVDLNGFHFSKTNSTNQDHLTVVCGLFDLYGNYLQGKKREISMRLTDQVLQEITNGMNVTTTFDVPPGAYQIRVVVRDAGTGLFSTANGSGIIQ